MADLAIVPADVKGTRNTSPVKVRTGGEAFDAGSALYQDPITNKYFKAFCDGTQVQGNATAFALSDCAGDGSQFASAEGGEVDPGAALDVGMVYCLSDTPGKIRPISDTPAGQYQSVIGGASAVNRLDLVFYRTGVLTASAVT